MSKIQSNLPSIKEFSSREARKLVLKVNLVGGLLVLLFFSYLVISHYESKLSYLFSSVEGSLSQAILRGDQQILDNLSRSIGSADDIAAVWITEAQGQSIVGTSGNLPSAPLLRGLHFNGIEFRKTISHTIFSPEHSELGALHVILIVPALQIFSLGILVLGLFLAISLLVLRAFNKVSNRLSQPMLALEKQISNLQTDEALRLDPITLKFREIESVGISFVSLLRKKEQSETTARESLRDAVKGRIASVVVHDVRQRLHNAFAIAESLKKKVGSIKEISLLHSALTSIDQTILDIPNVDLSSIDKNGLLQSELNDCAKDRAKENLFPIPLSPVIESVIREYRTKFDLADKKIKVVFEKLTAELFSPIEAIKFQRIVSNLLSNAAKAVEAVPSRLGEIHVMLIKNEESIVFCVKDNGIGCNELQLQQLGQQGFTAFINGGSGTGLSSTKAILSNWGGTIEFSSKPGFGFESRILLPLARSAGIFSQRLDIHGCHEVVIVDDDPSVHARWKSRLGPHRKLRSFYKGADFLSWCDSAAHCKGMALLMDFHLGNESKSGVDFASMAKFKGFTFRSIVTGNWFDQEVIGLCVKEKLNLLPKEMIESVDIRA